jgi:hypothetical protein
MRAAANDAGARREVKARDRFLRHTAALKIFRAADTLPPVTQANASAFAIA